MNPICGPYYLQRICAFGDPPAPQNVRIRRERSRRGGGLSDRPRRRRVRSRINARLRERSHSFTVPTRLNVPFDPARRALSCPRRTSAESRAIVPRSPGTKRRAFLQFTAVEKNKMSVVGLDFGNANNVVALARRKGIDVVLNTESKRETPSMVNFGAKQVRLSAPPSRDRARSRATTRRVASRAFQSSRLLAACRLPRPSSRSRGRTARPTPRPRRPSRASRDAFARRATTVRDSRRARSLPRASPPRRARPRSASPRRQTHRDRAVLAAGNARARSKLFPSAGRAPLVPSASVHAASDPSPPLVFPRLPLASHRRSASSAARRRTRSTCSRRTRSSSSSA